MRWEAPARCGCVLDIEAEWAHDPEDRNGERVQHAYPKMGTIRSISIVTVCPTHTAWQTDSLPADPYGGAPGYLPLTTQTHPQIARLPASAKLDPAQTTPAQKVFIRHFMLPGGVLKPDTCECQCYMSHQRGAANSEVFHDHPAHSKRCRHHGADVRHASAIGEHRSFHAVRNALLADHPELVRRVVKIGDAAVELDAQTQAWSQAPAQATNPFARLIRDAVPEERIADGVEIAYDESRQIVVSTKGRVQVARLRATVAKTGHGARVTVVD